MQIIGFFDVHLYQVPGFFFNDFEILETDFFIAAVSDFISFKYAESNPFHIQEFESVFKALLKHLGTVAFTAYRIVDDDPAEAEKLMVSF